MLGISIHAKHRWRERGHSDAMLEDEVAAAVPFGITLPCTRFLRLPSGLIAVVKPSSGRDLVVTVLTRRQAVLHAKKIAAERRDRDKQRKITYGQKIRCRNDARPQSEPGDF